MLDAGYLNDLNRVLASLQDRIELSAAERLTYFRADTSEPPMYPDERRGYARRQLRVRAVMDLKQTLPTIDRKRAFHCIYLRDISRTGIGFLHADELFPGEECRLWLPQKDVQVSIVNCRRKSASCYVIGARFCKS
ncbi:MAG: PilZ domain-containing protein [Planctomycetia bacterium]|nr:PilZ domain-containing protein [Planctomycetia bacterium]